MGDFLSDIGNAFGAVVQGVEHEVENLAGNVMGGMTGGAGQTHGASPVGGGSPADMLSNFDIGGFLSGGLNGIAGGLVGQFGGDAFGILGNIFASPTDAGASVAGYAHTGSFTGSASGSVSASVNGSGQPPPGHAPTANGSSKAPSSGSAAQATASGGVKAGDPRLEAAAEAIETIMINFSQFEGSVKTPYSGANGLPSGLVDRQSLLKLVNDPATGGDLKRAAEFLLNNPDVMNQLCTQLGMPNSGSFTFGQLDSMDGLLSDMKTGKATGGGITLPPPPPGHSAEASTAAGADGAGGGATTTSSSNGAGATAQGSNSDLSDVVSTLQDALANTDTSNPTAAAKKSSGTAQSISNLDDGIAGYQSDIEKQMKILADPKSTDVQRQAAQSQIQLDTLHMQGEMDALKQLFEMLSNMEKAYSDICMNAISNIR